MDSEEVTLWLARERFDPLPDPWAMHGQIAAMIHNAWYKGKGRRPADFIPTQQQQRRRGQTPEQHMRTMDRLRARLG